MIVTYLLYSQWISDRSWHLYCGEDTLDDINGHIEHNVARGSPLTYRIHRLAVDPNAGYQTVDVTEIDRRGQSVYELDQQASKVMGL